MKIEEIKDDWEKNFDWYWKQLLGKVVKAEVVKETGEEMKENMKRLLSQTRQEVIEEIIDDIIKLSSRYWVDRYMGSPTPLIVNKGQFKRFLLEDLNKK